MEINTDNYSAIKFIEEIGIVISAKELTPTINSLEYLKFSGTIPKDWQVAQPPILNPNFAQLNFENGVNIIAQPRNVSFIENLGSVVSKYVEKLPHAEYQTVSICPKILIPLPGSPDAPRKFITEMLFSGGSWQELGNKPLQAGVNLVYQLDKCQLNLNISEVQLQQSDRTGVSSLLFAGSYNYALINGERPQQLEYLLPIIANCKNDFLNFRDIIEQKFLRMANLAQFIQEETVFPVNVI
jgi:hypothetical protein